MKDSVCKKCRREGDKLFLKGERCQSSKCSFSRRPYSPGQHGPQKRRRKPSGFALELREKQRTKSKYGLRERQFKRFFNLASKTKDDKGATMLKLLERRLDNVCFKLGFAASLKSARQLVNHGHILVSGSKVDIPSYIVQPGQIIKVKNATNIKLVKTELPSWLKLDSKKTEGEIIKTPGREDISAEIKEDLIVEFYSR